MRPGTTLFVALLAAAAACTARATETIVIETATLRAEIGADSAWRSLIEKRTGRELLARDAKTAFAVADFEAAAGPHGAGTDGDVAEQQRLMAQSASSRARCFSDRARREGDRLVVGFAPSACELTFALSVTNDAPAFVLERIAGPRPVTLDFARVLVAETNHVGARLAAAWSESLAVGLAALDLQSTPSAKRVGNGTMLAAATQDAPGPELEGAGVALIVAPPAEYRGTRERFAVASGIPLNTENGTASRDLDLARASYWFLGFGEKDVDRVIDGCKRTGFRQVMLNSGSWCASPGHYLFNTNLYPDGQESLRRTVARLHAEGIRAGMHCYVSKIAKKDPYVSPVPDARFWTDRTAGLAGAIGPGDTVIRTTSDLREWPGSAVAAQTMWEGGVAKHREVILGDEIVQYESIGPAGAWNEFQGCRRGAWGTRPVAHAAGTTGRHYAVDGCIDGYIIDQETPLLDEVADRLAAIYNACDFDMVYFDGGEDVDRRRFIHYVSKFQLAAMRRFTKRPLVHMGTIMTHHLWPSFTRSGTVDTYLNTIRGRLLAGGTIERLPTVRDHIDQSVDYMLSIRDDMLPGELGWFGIWPRGKESEGLQLDEMEYLMARSLAYDAPVSLQTSFRSMDAHPLTPGLLEIARVYEQLRMSNAIPAATRAGLRCRQKDFALVRADGGWQLAGLGPVAAPDDGIRHSIGTVNGAALAILWGAEAGREIRIEGVGLRAEFIDGSPVETRADDAGLAFRIGPRRITLLAPRLTTDQLREALRKVGAVATGTTAVR